MEKIHIDHAGAEIPVPAWFPAELKSLIKEKPAIVRAFLLSPDFLRLWVIDPQLGRVRYDWEKGRDGIFRLGIEPVDPEGGVHPLLDVLLCHWWQALVKGCATVTEVCLWRNPETDYRVLPILGEPKPRVSLGKRRRRAER